MGTTDGQTETTKKDLSRRSFLKVAGGAVTLAAIPALLQGAAKAQEISPQIRQTWEGAHAVSPHDPSKPTVYFTRDLSPAGVQKITNGSTRELWGRLASNCIPGNRTAPTCCRSNISSSSSGIFRAARSLNAMFYIKAHAGKPRLIAKRSRSMALIFARSISWMRTAMPCCRSRG